MLKLIHLAPWLYEWFPNGITLSGKGYVTTASSSVRNSATTTGRSEKLEIGKLTGLVQREILLRTNSTQNFQNSGANDWIWTCGVRTLRAKNSHRIFHPSPSSLAKTGWAGKSKLSWAMYRLQPSHIRPPFECFPLNKKYQKHQRERHKSRELSKSKT